MATTTYRQNQQTQRNDQHDSRQQPANQNQAGQNQNGKNNNGPVELFRLSNVSIAIFENESERDGHKSRYHRAAIDKRYHDPKSGEWKSSSSFSTDELLRLRYLIDEAVGFMASKPGD